MSYKANIVANYLSQAYVIVVGMLVVPVYLRLMGAEGYGLISFFAVLQACFQLLDLGLSATVVRETAQFRGGAIDALSLRKLLRALEALFLCTALIAAVAISLSSTAIARDWLRVERLAIDEVRVAIILMALNAAFRWVSGLYRGIITGFERLVWLSGFNAMAATMRFLLVIPVLLFVGAGPRVFFFYQLLVAMAEAAALCGTAYCCMPALAGRPKVGISLVEVTRVFRFSMGMAFVSVIGLILSQADKVLLSRMLSLSDYAQYNLATVLAGGIMMAGGPIVMAMLPRLNRYSAQRDCEALYGLYRQSTQIVATVVFPVTAVLAFFAREILWIWTGDAALAAQGAPILAFYALGNGFMAIAVFPSHLQVAEGKLRLYVMGAMFFLCLFVGSLSVLSSRYGATGAAAAWLAANLVYFACWVPLVHRHFRPGLHRAWLKFDLGGVLVTTALAALLMRYLMTWSAQRMTASLELAGISLLVLAAGMAGSPFVRSRLLARWRAGRRLVGLPNER